MSSVILETNDCFLGVPVSWATFIFIPMYTTKKQTTPSPPRSPTQTQKTRYSRNERSAYESKRTMQFFKTALFACSVRHFTVFCFFLLLFLKHFTHNPSFFSTPVSSAREHVRFLYHDANSLGNRAAELVIR